MKRDRNAEFPIKVSRLQLMGVFWLRRGLAIEVDYLERRLSMTHGLETVFADELSAKPIDANDAIYDQAIAA